MIKLLLPAACLLAALAISCSGDSANDPASSPTTRAETTASPAATTTPAPTATPVQPTATPEPPTPEPPPEPPTPEPAPPAPPAPSGPPPAPVTGPTSTTIVASGLAFSTRTINARAGASVTIVLNNQDTFVAHDLAISGIAAVPSCLGPCTNSVIFTAPAAGRYAFVCTVHPADMTGTLVVSP